jgi:predicted ATPase
MRALGAEPSQELCTLVHSVSAGNPWFMRETVEGLIIDHGRAALATLSPSDVRAHGSASEQLRTRCLALDIDVRQLLEVASVLGVQFEVELVARMSERPSPEVLDALEIACAEGLASFEAARSARFAHDLVRGVLYEGLEIGDRLRLHLRAARALEQAFDPLRVGEIAHH